MATTKTSAAPAAAKTEPKSAAPKTAAAKTAAAKTVAKPAAKAPAKAAPAKVAAKPAAVTPVVDGDACALPGADAPKKRYRLLTGVDDSSFCQKVSDALADGYELYGSPSITFTGKTAYAAQAVVLKKVPKRKKK
jgi:hypothetical protein